MKARFLSTIGLWAMVILGVTLLGPHGAVAIVAAVALATQAELYRILKKLGFRPLSRLGLGLGLLVTVSSYYAPECPVEIIAIVAASCGALTRGKGGRSVESLMSTLFGIIYVAFTLKHLILMMAFAPGTTGGILIALWAVVVGKFTDVGGFLFGSQFGRHKLAPRVSPGKTWEGAVGGVTTAVIVSALFAAAVGNWTPSVFSWEKACILAIPLGIVAVISDLMESIIKRQAGVKDSGNMIPGIGGMFDLTDSLILSAPVAYYLLKYLVF